MPRTCLSCSSPEREAIDKALVAGESFRNIAKRVSISPAGLLRHKNHVANAIGKAQAKQEERFAERRVGIDPVDPERAWTIECDQHMLRRNVGGQVDGSCGQRDGMAMRCQRASRRIDPKSAHVMHGAHGPGAGRAAAARNIEVLPRGVRPRVLHVGR